MSKHLRVLSRAGLVEARPSGNRRYYSLLPQRFLQLYEWLDSFRRMTDNRLDGLDDYLHALQGTGMDSE